MTAIAENSQAAATATLADEAAALHLAEAKDVAANIVQEPVTENSSELADTINDDNKPEKPEKPEKLEKPETEWSNSLVETIKDDTIDIVAEEVADEVPDTENSIALVEAIVDDTTATAAEAKPETKEEKETEANTAAIVPEETRQLELVSEQGSSVLDAEVTVAISEPV
ncbi:hypothetical protein IWW47_003021, partial [Coemansia sp. RSA 2052]